MKKIFSFLLCLFLVAEILCGIYHVADCPSWAITAEAAAESRPLTIVTTIFPVYDWVVHVLGEKAEKAEVTMLLDTGVDLHSYQPTADDIVRISECDVFFYVGGESDEWVEDALRQVMNPNRIAVNLLEALGENAREEELAEGMEGYGDEDEEEEEPEYDEHIWLSLKNASLLCRVIADALGQADADNKDIYTSSAAAYIGKLDALDERYAAAVTNGSYNTLLFGDRFPFRYLVEDYGLNYYAAFSGCSAESEASFETIGFLAGKVDELGLHTVLTIEGSNHRIAETIVSVTKNRSAQILSLNSLQSVTALDVKNGADYLKIMESNLAVLEAALQ